MDNLAVRAIREDNGLTSDSINICHALGYSRKPASTLSSILTAEMSRKAFIIASRLCRRHYHDLHQATGGT